MDARPVHIVENHGFSVACALRKSVARPAGDPGQWDHGFMEALGKRREGPGTKYRSPRP